MSIFRDLNPKRLIDPNLGGRMPIEQFPSLLQMEAHTGFSGVFFTVIWFGLAYVYHPALWNVAPSFLNWSTGIVIASFFVLSWAATAASQHVLDRIEDTHADGDDPAKLNMLGRRARVFILLFSGLYIFVCCYLIWLTGGANSPFTPFFIMIFTLTVDRTQVPYPGFVVLTMFLCCILITVFAYYIFPPPWTNELSNIQKGHFQSVMMTGFICASLIVPTASKYFLRRRANRLRRLKEQKARVTGDTANV